MKPKFKIGDTVYFYLDGLKKCKVVAIRNWSGEPLYKIDWGTGSATAHESELFEEAPVEL